MSEIELMRAVATGEHGAIQTLKPIYEFEVQPLCGLAHQARKPVGSRVTLRMPVLVPDLSAPIRNGKGELKGYRSKPVGTALVKDFPVIETLPFQALSYLRSTRGRQITGL